MVTTAKLSESDMCKDEESSDDKEPVYQSKKGRKTIGDDGDKKVIRPLH